MYFLLVLQQFIASTTHVIAKNLTFEVLPPVVLLFRAIVAVVIFTTWILIRNKGKFRKIDRSDIPKFIILGALNIPINQFLFLTSVEMTSPPNVALAYALTPAFVLIIALLFLKESASFIKIAGVAVAIAGTVLVLSEKGFNFSARSFQGDLLALTASFSWAFYTIIGKGLSRKYGAIYSTAMAMIIGLILYVPIFFVLPIEYDLSAIESIHWLQIFYLGAFTSVIGYALWYMALKKIEASKVAVFNNIQPIFTTILSIIFFAYPLSPTFIAGGTLIIIGVVMTQRG